LTDLPNRRLLVDRLEQAIARAERSGGSVAVLLLDLDGFKQVNDLYGHRMGDRALQAIVRRLKLRIRASDTLARTGGDEFTVVSENIGDDKSDGLIAALENALSTPCDVDGKNIQTGVSIGAAMYPRDGRTPDELCAAADEAMYAVKRSVRRMGTYPG
jgi:diguanylate cyclase (GGDEF)-like protein